MVLACPQTLCGNSFLCNAGDEGSAAHSVREGVQRGLGNTAGEGSWGSASPAKVLAPRVQVDQQRVRKGSCPCRARMHWPSGAAARPRRWFCLAWKTSVGRAALQEIVELPPNLDQWDAMVQAPWNWQNKPPLEEWLLHTRRQENENRLIMIGNTVRLPPRQAAGT